MASLSFPAIGPVAFRVGPLAVRWYGLAYVAGFLFVWWMLARLNRAWRLGLDADRVALVVLAGIAGVVAGGRLGYVVFYGGPAYWSHPASILAIWDGGMSFHGGLAGAVLAGYLVSRRVGVRFLRLCDAVAVAAPFGLLLGRLANFANGELWGRVTRVPWGVVFPKAGPLPRHPSQLYEAALEGAVLLTVMLVLARRRRPDGELLGWLMLLYGVFRIAVESFRQPDVQIGFLAGGVTMGQILSVPVVAAGAWLVWRARRRGAGGERPDEQTRP